MDEVSVNAYGMEAWRHNFLLLMAKYSPKDIFNSDECSLSYNILSDRCTHSKSKLQGIKLNVSSILTGLLKKIG
jgi:hypothetical protein